MLNNAATEQDLARSDGVPIRSLLTGSDNVTLLDTIPTDRVIAAWLAEFSIDIAEELHGIPRIFKYRCNDTGVIFFSPADLAGSERLYQKLQRIPWYYQTEKWEYGIARRELHGANSVFEVGCGTGEFLKILRNDSHEVAGVELNKRASAQARLAGLNVSDEPLEQLSLSHQEKFDAVCSFQVLEHVPDPANFISKTIELVRPGGKVVFAVPNAAGFEGLGYNLLQDPPHHMTWWTADCFRALPSLFPLTLDKVVTEPLARGHIYNYLRWNMLHLQERSAHSGWIFNRTTLAIYKRLLLAGLTRFVAGHALYAQFAKL